MPQLSKHRSPAALLRGAAVLFAALGLGVVAWLADKALRYPTVRAVQASAEAPLWMPFMLFVAGCTVAVVLLFLRAARRVDAGEDLFARRHRRAPQPPDAGAVEEQTVSPNSRSANG